jgi:hypothetical protein
MKRVALLLVASALSCTLWAQSPAANQFPFGPATAKQVDPQETLKGIEADIRDLIGQTDKKMFGLTPAQSEKVRFMLSGMQRGVSELRAKYRRVKDPVDAAPLYDEIETSLEKHGGGDKLLLLALKGKSANPAQSKRCDSYCWKQCGPNHVGDWGCFLTCQRHC